MIRKLSDSVGMFVVLGIVFIVWAFLWSHKFYLYFAGIVCFYQAYQNYSK